MKLITMQVRIKNERDAAVKQLQELQKEVVSTSLNLFFSIIYVINS